MLGWRREGFFDEMLNTRGLVSREHRMLSLLERRRGRIGEDSKKEREIRNRILILGQEPAQIERRRWEGLKIAAGTMTRNPDKVDVILKNISPEGR